MKDKSLKSTSIPSTFIMAKANAKAQGKSNNAHTTTCTSKSILLLPSAVGNSQVNTSQKEYNLHHSLETCDKVAFHIPSSTDLDSKLDDILLDPRTATTLSSSRTDLQLLAQTDATNDSRYSEVTSDDASDITLDGTFTTDLHWQDDAVQLQKWIYEVSNANITTAERLEKSRWEVKRLERL